MANDYCPFNPNGKHFYKAYQTKTDFEPVQYGSSADDTLYKRVEYSYSNCACGMGVKARVRQVNYNHED